MGNYEKNSIHPTQFLGFGKDITPFTLLLSNFIVKTFSLHFLNYGQSSEYGIRLHDDLVCFGVNKLIEFSSETEKLINYFAI
jgi:hypothetical protein